VEIYKTGLNWIVYILKLGNIILLNDWSKPREEMLPKLRTSSVNYYLKLNIRDEF